MSEKDELEKLNCAKGITNFAFKPCAECTDLLSCVLGRRMQGIDEGMSNFARIAKYNWLPTNQDLNAMSFEQLCEVNEAFDAVRSAEQTEKMRENSMLTAGSWDRERGCWVTDTTTGTDAHKPTKSNLTAGKWNIIRKQWEI